MVCKVKSFLVCDFSYPNHIHATEAPLLQAPGFVSSFSRSEWPHSVSRSLFSMFVCVAFIFPACIRAVHKNEHKKAKRTAVKSVICDTI